MPVLPTVLGCVCCGRLCTVTLQSVEDPRRPSLPMAELIKIQAAHNLCQECRARYNWLASQGRQQEFLRQSVGEVLKPTGYRES